MMCLSHYLCPHELLSQILRRVLIRPLIYLVAFLLTRTLAGKTWTLTSVRTFASILGAPR